MGSVHRIRVNEQQPVTSGLFSELLTGKRFSRPVFRERLTVYQPDAAVSLGKFTDDFRGFIFGIIVQHNDFKIRIVLFLERFQTIDNIILFVPGRHQDRDEGRIIRDFAL